MENFYFLKKKELSKLNAKERQEYISTQKRYSKFQIAINTGMLKLHPDKSEFNPAGHRSDFHYLWEVYSRVKNKNNNLKIKKEEKVSREERVTATKPSSSDIGARLKKLRQMYKDGILSKVEFEKAKNKLLK